MDHKKFRGTTILMVRRGDKVAVAGDGQVTLGDMVMKHHAKKVRKLYHGKIIVGFAGSAADALTLFERLEAKLEKHQGNLTRSVVELAKDWRTDRILRRLEALLLAVDATRRALDLRHGRCHRARRGSDGHRLRRALRPGRGPGPPGPHGFERKEDLQGGHENRGVFVRLYQ